MATNANTVETILHGSVGLLTARSGGHLVSLQCYVSPYDIFEEGTGIHLNLTDSNGTFITENWSKLYKSIRIGLKSTAITTVTHVYFTNILCSAMLTGCKCFCHNRGNLGRLQTSNCSPHHWIPPGGQQGVRECPSL